MYTSLSQATVVFAETEVYFHCTYTLHIAEVLRRHGCGGVHQAKVGVLHQVDLQQGGEQCSHKTNMGRNSQVHCKVKSF